MYQTVLFDLDGTLTDPKQGIFNSLHYAMDKLKLPRLDEQKMLTFIGPPLLTSFSQSLHLSAEDSQKALYFYRAYFKKQGIFENQVYDGIEDLLASLQQAGKKIILATSKPQVFAQQILEHFELDHYFDFLAGASLDHSRTSKTDVIAYALEQVGDFDPEKIVMVGDREHDIIGARENGLASLGVLYGYGSQVELTAAAADSLVASVAQLKEKLLA